MRDYILPILLIIAALLVMPMLSKGLGASHVHSQQNAMPYSGGEEASDIDEEEDVEDEILSITAPHPKDANYKEAREAERWVIQLGSKVSALALKNYDVAVFDAYEHPLLRPLEFQGKDLMARTKFFVSSERMKFYSGEAKDQVFFTEEKDGKEITFVDIRNPEWLSVMIEKKLPFLVKQGFNGLLLEGINDVVMLERKNPQKYMGMIEAIGRFIRTVKQHYPYMKIMLKDTMQVLSSDAKYIDKVLFVQHDNEGMLSDKSVEITMKWMEGLRQENPAVKFYSLDYVDMKHVSRDKIKSIYTTRRAQGVIPYVAEKGLKEHYVEPY